jgi:hypothetical protein
MKKAILYVLGLLLLTSCAGYCPTIKKPHNLKSIDWNNYNDVPTVYWNYMGYCEDVDWRRADTVSVYGYGYGYRGFLTYEDRDFFYLSEQAESTEPHAPPHSITIIWSKENNEAIASKLNTADFSKKCFVRGTIELPCLDTMGCSKVDVEIFISNPDDIYFEE